jgi:hypothetical protein
MFVLGGGKRAWHAWRAGPTKTNFCGDPIRPAIGQCVGKEVGWVVAGDVRQNHLAEAVSETGGSQDCKKD